jgi:hypothetical protein
MNRLLSIVLICLLFACKNGNGVRISNAAINKKDSLLRVLTYGLANLQGGTADAVIAKQYHFCYYPVTGCIVTKELLDSINAENAKVYQALAKEYGANWKQEYTRKVDSLFALLEQAKAIVSKQPLVQQLNHQHNNDLYYHVAPTDTANVFRVQAFSTGSDNFSTAFKINLQTRQVDRVK